MHLCKKIPRPLLLVSGLLLSCTLFAQDSKYAGRYNGSRHELAQEVILLPDHRFIYSSSYGASDELVRGKWEVREDTLLIQEEQLNRAPFAVYGRYNDTISQGRQFTFNDYSQNVEIVFGFDSGTAVDSFRRLFSPDQTTFSHHENLRVISKPVQVFSLAMPSVKVPSSSLYDIYDFTPSNMNELRLFYIAPRIRDSVVIRAIVRDDSLLFVTADEGLKAFGIREPLAPSLREYDEVFSQRDIMVPDSIRMNGDMYYLLQPTASRSAEIHISNAGPHFARDEAAEIDAAAVPADPVIDVVAPPPPPAPPKQKKKH
ncbi:MAG TPA: hypothetical protein VGE90_09750 [Chitinophaga sp.]